MHIESYHGDRSALLPLFALADDSRSEIASYMSLGEMLVAWHNDLIVGHAQILHTDEPGLFEMKSLAVKEVWQGAGIGQRLVGAAADYCRARNGRRLIVSTAAADIDNLRFYQRRGFRMARIARDAFGPLKGYPDGAMVDGIPLRDRVFLDLSL